MPQLKWTQPAGKILSKIQKAKKVQNKRSKNKNKKIFENEKKYFIKFFSRAHTIVQINFTQKGKNDSGEGTTKTSCINLVDLAGR